MLPCGFCRSPSPRYSSSPRCPSWPACRSWCRCSAPSDSDNGSVTVTAALELGGAVLLLVPTLAGIGAVVLAIVMVGAILAHTLVLGGSAVPAIVLLAATVTIAWFRIQQAPSRVPGLIQTQA